MRPMTLFHFVMPFGRKLGTLGLSLGMLVFLWMDAAGAVSRIKDIATFEGVRSNMLVGYGLVVGLNGTGDSLSNSPFTKQSLIGLLERLGVNVRDDALKTDNVAAVMVTATLPPFARHGTQIDVTVSDGIISIPYLTAPGGTTFASQRRFLYLQIVEIRVSPCAP